MRTGILSIAALCTLLNAHPAAATGYYCTEPREPSCISSYGGFDDEWEFNMCKTEVEQYLDDVSRFQTCLADWHGAIDNEANDVIESFNCKARGDNYC